MSLMFYLTLIMIFNFNINVFFNYYNFILIVVVVVVVVVVIIIIIIIITTTTIMIICNVGSLSEHITNILMLKCHYISLVFVLYKRPDDELVNPKHVAYLFD
jgi:hypothetical protein